jgi:Ca2+/H+ antiporter
MELALATRKAKTRRLRTVGSRQVLFLLLLAYAIAYVVPACVSFTSRQANEEPRSTAFFQGSDFNLHAELVCESAPPRLWERSVCNLPK